ncbi:response regulator transcription factor [Sphingomonas sp. NFR15]|uniref:response regulator transcription factor n=1 Tax=Sphingomonas sp. NFR15 TaxID=1566282 RepID=UPI00087F4590|nr:response regulator [Sphingomonas sp. NFR15]SDA35892.1 Response regulator receiver domain-containing protein [Sphingomonas sp. NFR15]
MVEALPPTGSVGLIAIVDDDEDVASALGSLVESMGMAARLFSSADNFLSERHERFVLVISDVQMPGSSGIDLARLLQNDAVPVILITAFPSLEIERQALACGVHRFIRKPFDPDELIDSIMRVVAQSPGRTSDIII